MLSYISRCCLLMRKTPAFYYTRKTDFCLTSCHLSSNVKQTYGTYKCCPQIQTRSVGKVPKFPLVPWIHSARLPLQARTFKTSSSLHLNPVIIALLRPISKLVVILVGRHLRTRWRKLPKYSKLRILHHFRKHRLLYMFLCLGLGGCGYEYYTSHVTVLKFSNRTRFMAFTSDQLLAIAAEMFQEEMDQYREKIMSADHPHVQYVKQVAQRLLKANSGNLDLSNKTWSVTVIDADDQNCYVLPDGHIIVFRGMLELTVNEDQLAVILAHEMGHAILEHSAERLSYFSLIEALMLFPMAVIWTFLPNDGVAAITHWFLQKVVNIQLLLPYSRKLEREADSYGLMMIAQACYDVREASAFWGMLDYQDKMNQMSGKPLEVLNWLSTHPANSERQKNLDGEMERAISYRSSCQCPKLPKRDPRKVVEQLQKIAQAKAEVKQIVYKQPRQRMVALR